jgi:arylsulfatase A-like enzyme
MTIRIAAILVSLVMSLHAAPPNIIYILADDAGMGDFECFQGTVIPTPNINRMAAEGMKLTRHYSGSTVCAPSRCVLLTGLHAGHCRIRGNSPGLMQPEDVTIAEILKAAGYRTGNIGKWGLGNPPPLDDPARNGFDYFYGYVSMWHAHNFYPEFIIRNGEQVPLRNEVYPQWKNTDGRGIARVKKDYVPDLMAEEVVAFIERNKAGPFFLYYAFNTPHANNEAGRKDNPAPEKGMEVPDFGAFADTDWPPQEKGFAAMVANIDRDVGRVLDTLKALGLEKNTLVMFSSDNGPHQEGGHQMEFHNSNGLYRGMKRDMYEGGVHVPAIAWWPGTINAGRSSDLLSGFQDILPTFAEVAGVQVPENIDGLSMLPTLTGKGQQARHKTLYWEFTEQGGKRALLKGDWKIVQLKLAAATPALPELYNLRSDPEEKQNLASQYPEKVQELLALMDQAHTPSSTYPLFPSEKP